MKQAGRKHVKSKWAVAGLFVLSVCASVAFAKDKLLADEHDYKVMATVGGIPVTMPEFEKSVQRNKSGVLSYFHDKYSAEQIPGFWTSSFEGEVPQDLLKKRALDDSLRIKVTEWIAMEQGVINDISYQGFLKQLEQENARRMKAAANHQVIYGPLQYNEDTYLQYILTNAATAVKQKIQLDEHLKPDELALKAFYEKHKHDLYQTPGDIKLFTMAVSFLDANHQVDPVKKERAGKQLKEAAAMLESGASFADTAKTYSDRKTEDELVINLGNDRNNSRSPVARAAAKMNIGETSDIVEENGSLYLLRCTDKTDPGSAFVPFEEIADQVLKDYIDREYENMIQIKLDEAQVNVDESLYQSWKVEE
ncbi:peptidyl-prolyl cis-trans isomerase [Paenibacillus sp. HJL G12]|uniref:peptidylprolyl isomerase n=1 Tax=Paenibacillus dendrobii TaxID=2691084 RepID=A0A7X3LH79_9BACL|nr:peptidylprolyl isomerase [Paenibacillus dendrobii]MWV42919.1 peptidyl-prolyl cis-trans isomerase [Paenibacillus dendrobii]